MKYFMKKLLGHEIFRSMVSWAAKISLEICKILSPPPPAYLMYAPLLEINAIRAKSQLGTEEIRVKVKLLELHLMPAILHELTVCGRILTREWEEIVQMQSKALKQLLQVPVSTSIARVLMETGIWPAKEYIQYNDAIS